jgi:tRNA(Ser,Leu) C12 N-acetylase TAN1
MGLSRSLKTEQRIVPLMGMMFFIFQVAGMSSLDAQQKSTRQSSLDAFSQGKYEQAYSEFSELLVTYPKDPLYKYYSGVCLVKLNRNTEEAVQLLQQTQQGSAVVRAVPSDALFWLGRAQQIEGMFNEAVSSYNAFTEQYGKKAARDLDVPAYTQQCIDKKGQKTEQSAGSVISEKKVLKPDKPVSKIPEPLNDEKQISEKKEPGKDTIPGNFDIILSEALDYQFKADSLSRIAEGWGKSLEKLDYKGKTELRARIAETESLAASYQKRADQKYNEAQAAMNSTSFATVKIPDKDIVHPADSSAGKKEVSDASLSEKNIFVKKDAAIVNKDTVKTESFAKKLDDMVKKDSAALPPPVKPVECFTFFEIRPFQPNAVEKIPINATIPPGLIYRIQVAVFRNPVTMSYFKGISPVYGFRVAGTDKTAYYAGMFRRIADARKALLTVKQKGFKDAFIVALSGGKAVSIERAAVLEKEWGKKSFVVAQTARKTPADTIPPALCFRVEVMRSVKPVKDDVLAGMKKIAGTRGLDTESLNNETVVYLIGEFITYESAEDYAGLLIRNGYRSAKVVARLGKKEVPVETAKELFEKVE